MRLRQREGIRHDCAHTEAEQEKIVRSPKLIDGYDIIYKFGVPPGPEVGTLLEAVLEAQAAGEVTSREEALSLIERLKKHV